MGKKDNKKKAKPAPKKVVKKPAPKKVAKPAPKKVVSKPVPKKVAKPIAKKPMKVAPHKAVKAPVKNLAKGKSLTSKIANKIQLSVQKKKELTHKKGKEVKEIKAAKAAKPLSKKELKALEKEKLLKQKVKIKEEKEIVDTVAVKKKSKAEVAKEEITEEILGLAEEFAVKEIFAAIKSLDFFKADADDCLEKGCDNPATTMGYCRFHYIKNWKDIQKKKIIISEGKLQALIEELTKKYPLRFIQAILDDLMDEKAFHSVLTELNIESDEFEDDLDDEADDDIDIVAMETKSIGKGSFEEDI